MYKLKENYTVGTKGLCSTDSSYGFYRENFDLRGFDDRALFAAFFTVSDAYDSIYTESTEALVAFKFGIDFPQNALKYASFL